MLKIYNPIKIAMFDNRTLNLTGEQVLKKMGCDLLINAALYNPDRSLCCDVKINNTWISNDMYSYFGYAWSGNDFPQLVHTNDADKFENFISCVDVVPNMKRGRTAIGRTADNRIVVLCVADGTDALTIPEVRAKLRAQGCVDDLVLDGGYSSELISAAEGTIIKSTRRAACYIGIWIEKESNKKMKICLDPGHGLKEMNQSPDGTYIEHEFALDMANRVRPHLIRCGCEVLLTREDSSTPGLKERAAKANAWGADLYASLHTNAVPDNDPTDENTPEDGWDNPAGLTVWTCAAGGERDRAANILLKQMKSAGVSIFGSGLYHSNFTVLACTNMPAFLTEYAFHTNKEDVKLLKSSEYRAKLAEATAKAIAEWCGIAWVPDTTSAIIVDESKMIYHLQFGAFTDESNAVAMKKMLKEKGYTTIIKEEKK